LSPCGVAYEVRDADTGSCAEAPCDPDWYIRGPLTKECDVLKPCDEATEVRDASNGSCACPDTHEKHDKSNGACVVKCESYEARADDDIGACEEIPCTDNWYTRGPTTKKCDVLKPCDEATEVRNPSNGNCACPDTQEKHA